MADPPNRPRPTPGRLPLLEQTGARPPSALATEEHRRDRPYLIVMAGAAMGVMHKIGDAAVTIGRGEKADLRIIDDGISREHSRVSRRGEQVFIEDLGSTNGTFCNGLRVTAQPLREGDKILIGASTILKFTYHDALDEIFQRQLTESALRDALTKVYNRKYLLDHLQGELARAVRQGMSLALIFLDIDRFKAINDGFGHPAGDSVLVELATLLSRSLRTEDLLARYGGEEFAVVCRGLDRAKGAALAERLRVAVAEHTFTHEDRKIPVTVSLGVAAVPDRRIGGASDLFAAADEAMYQAKRSGRNRVSVHEEDDSGNEEPTGKQPLP